MTEAGDRLIGAAKEMRQSVRRETLEALLERVRNASGPDRDLDEALYRIERERERRTRVLKPGEGWLTADTEYTPAYTASIDAALGLVERALPGACWRVARTLPTSWIKAPFWATCGLPGEQEDGEGATPALALLCALLTALIAQETKE